MKRLVLAVLAVFILVSIASAQTTMNMTGFIRVQGELNNFGYGANGLNGAATTFSPTLKKDDRTASFVDQRARMFFNLKSGDNLGGTFAYEIDTRWGQPATYGTSKPVGGGSAGADAVNVETKHIYMWYNLNPDLKLTAGIQPYSDEFNGITFFGEDLAGIRADYKLSKDSSLTLGYFLLKDSSAAAGLTDGVFYIPVTYKQNLGEGKLAVTYAYFKDSEGATKINEMAKALTTNTSLNTYSVNYLGATYNGKAGSVDYYASLLYNFGSYGGDGDISGFAVQAGGDFKAGAGKLRARLIYTSGDDNSTDNDYDGLVVATAYDTTASIPLCCNDLMFLVRALEESITHSAAILQDASGYGRGVLLAYLSYDQNLSDKMNVQATIANARFNEKKNATDKKGLGTEINLQARYKMEKNLSLTLGAGYLMLGDAYDKSDAGKDPSDPYKLFARLTYSF